VKKALILHNGNLGEKSAYVYLAVLAGFTCPLEATLQCSADKKFGNHWSMLTNLFHCLV